VRKERFLENPELWKNEKAVIPTRNRKPHELIRAMVSPGSAKSIRAHIFFEAPQRLGRRLSEIELIGQISHDVMRDFQSRRSVTHTTFTHHEC